MVISVLEVETWYQKKTKLQQFYEELDAISKETCRYIFRFNHPFDNNYTFDLNSLQIIHALHCSKIWKNVPKYKLLLLNIKFFSALFDVASTSGYQIVASTSEAKQIKDLVLTNFQGRLIGDGIDEQLPTVAIVTHYDSFGIAPVSTAVNYS